MRKRQLVTELIDEIVRQYDNDPFRSLSLFIELKKLIISDTLLIDLVKKAEEIFSLFPKPSLETTHIKTSQGLPVKINVISPFPLNAARLDVGSSSFELSVFENKCYCTNFIMLKPGIYPTKLIEQGTSFELSPLVVESFIKMDDLGL